MRPIASGFSPRTLIALAAGFGSLAIASFFLGIVFLGLGARAGSRRNSASSAVSAPDTAVAGSEPTVEGKTGPGPQTEGEVSAPEGGFFSRLRRTAAGAFSHGDQPSRAGFDGGRPVGLYLMTRYQMATRSLEKAVYYFTKDGRVYENLETGFSEDALAAHKGRHGTVSLTGDKMLVKWNDGPEEETIERDKDGVSFAWDMGLFGPVTAFKDSSDLVGKWEGGESLHISGSRATTSRELDMRTDGTFSGESVASFKSESNGSVASSGSSGATAGTWRLDGYQLTLTYQNGSVINGISFPFDDEKTPIYPDRFFFRGTMYKKE
ncbi:MAG TPA: hypothetical protein VHL58_10280 [Thermoanaerobaculia bacterium]|nr:hypothetical protein [Thermoanaerobaculia bacterium]